MSASRASFDWERLETLFEAILALPNGERGDFLERECPEPEWRAELESLFARAESAERLFDALAVSLDTLPARLGPADRRAEERTRKPAEPPPGPEGSASGSPAADPPLGSTVGHFRIEGRLGVGGMGVVYRARDTRLEREVALKFLPSHLDLDPEAKERLRLEARAAAALDHESLCTVHEIGETGDGRLFIAMACYEGETLRERIARGPLPVADAVPIAARIARGLAAAHAHGIVHRDVKPGNVVLTAKGGVKLLDFGLAKLADVTLTRPGVTPGTVAYMLPEQVRGEAADPRSDLWSLGVVLYEMLAGRRPFRGEGHAAVMHAILHEEPEAVGSLRLETPEHLAATLRRLLAKNAAERYPDAERLLADLKRVRSAGKRTLSERPASGGSAGLSGRRAPTRPEPAPTPASGGRWRFRIALGLVALVGIAWAGPRFLSRDTGTGDPGTGAAEGQAAIGAGDRPGAPGGGGADGSAGSRAPAPGTVAVLPFVNVGGDPEEEYFSDGLTEELIAALSRIRTVRVAARTSAFAFKGEHRDIREIGRALSVATVLEGSVRREGDRVRVAARLIDVENGFHLWSETYERRMTAIFELQSDLAVRIADALEAEVTPAERARLARKPTESPEAYTLYLKGRYFFNRRTGEGLARALDYFRRAIEVDPQYALAHAGLAGVYAPLGFFEYVHPREGGARMRDAARQAVRLDEGLAEAHTALAAYLHIYEWDPVGAEREFLVAIELNPRDPTTQQWYGHLLKAEGRFEEALSRRRMAVELDPLAAVQLSSLAGDFYLVGRPDLALDHYREALELDPGFWQAHAGMAHLHEANGELDKALRAFQTAVAHAGPTRQPRAALARVLALDGREAEARAILDTLRAEVSRDGIYTPQVASVLYALGDADGALEWLERAYRQRHPQLRYPGLGWSGASGLAEDPRLRKLLRRIGVPAPRTAPLSSRER